MKTKQTFLVVKLADLGDIITSIPALKALRETYPDCHIDILTSPIGYELLEPLQLINGFILTDRHIADSAAGLFKPHSWAVIWRLVRQLRQRPYNAAFLMHHLSTRFGALKWRILLGIAKVDKTIGLDNGRGGFLSLPVPDAGFGAKHEVEYALSLVDAIGASTSNTTYSLAIPDSAAIKAEQLLSEIKRPFIVIHPGSGGYSLARRWPPERFAALAMALSQQYAVDIVLAGGKDDNVAETIASIPQPVHDLSGKTDVLTLAAILSQAALFIGNDGGVMHLATAAGASVLAIFGPSNARAWGPWRPTGKPALFIQGKCPENGPCLYTGHTVGSRTGCPERYCLQSISVEAVLDVIANNHLL